MTMRTIRKYLAGSVVLLFVGCTNPTGPASPDSVALVTSKAKPAAIQCDHPTRKAFLHWGRADECDPE